MADPAALERVRVLAGRWAAIEGDSIDAEINWRVGSHLLAVVCEDSSAEFRLAEVMRLAESWLTPGLPTMFYPAAGQRVLDAIKDLAAEAAPVTITKGDVIRIVPELGPERLMVVSHMEHHIITLTDPED